MKRKHRTSVLVKALLFGLAVYAAVVLVQLQLDIQEKRGELRKINEQIEEPQDVNDELRAGLERGNSDEYVGSVARDEGFVLPGERVYLDTSSK